ncbi:MAG: hypothetical protein ACXWZI_17950 [Mycobacterium sp.]
MRNAFRRAALVTALPWVVGGCAVQGGGTAEPATPATAISAQVATAAPQPATAQPARTRPQASPPTALETRYGIQITQIGLAAAGGLVDFRFKVLDVAKARKLLGDPANVPVLIAGDSPPLMPPRHALHGAKFGPGTVYYILYPNVRNAVRPGVEVTVAMGDVRLGPVTVQ